MVSSQKYNVVNNGFHQSACSFFCVVLFVGVHIFMPPVAQNGDKLNWLNDESPAQLYTIQLKEGGITNHQLNLAKYIQSTFPLLFRKCFAFVPSKATEQVGHEPPCPMDTSPPDLDDYAPECLEGRAMAPFQQRAPALENESLNHGTKREADLATQTPRRSESKVPKVDRGNSTSHQGLMC